MTHPAITAQLKVAAEDLGQAREGLQDTLDYLREHAQPWPLNDLQRIVDDPYVISKVGDLQIRLEVAAALLERARRLDGSPEQRLVASSEAVIASADALQAVGNIQYELTGQRSSLPAPTGREPLRWHYQVIGNQRLNGVVPPQLQE
ncbi:acyl-CoA dehydrogenase family protein [Pseudomonas amygdali]|uniref:acyl-CoA dehydrogenase family protein n=1 Tax=Pseudomonas amygdali TaxID=47877 RepID=UPI0001CC37B1|nr:acyl-CoA dehydrogenase family protein [Pseudomonas amygdali]KWT15574.1 acyl-CoA dehydrogenase [Pseudomonas amygdali pv. aesculi]KWT15738.1 acyl-CoA dehydrogenase [Pseudomonas amygdali pv. aesculi]KWT19226.1 acyl-CoA dehydrogenase [Pseudomonas amygdali pv. aesculi]KWT19516.1 acyl-CoA dehydrogenase [Pseudomonas amygdali pv. aesculi]KWT36935.1 acyl-CoA dehydrogenase [Pseudomonas amygdali pv. aesculi]